MDDAIVPRSMVGEWKEDLERILWVREERHSTELGRRMSAKISSHGDDEIVEALCWLFRGWKISSIARCIEGLRLGGRLPSVLAGLMKGWSARHAAELLTVLYFSPTQCLGERREAWETIRLLPRMKAMEVINIMQSLTNCQNNVVNEM